MTLGVALPGFFDTSQLASFEAATGTRPGSFLLFADVADDWNGDRVAPFVARGVTPILTWLPVKATLEDIAAGKWDSQIAKTARWSVGTGLQIRFGHEMNLIGSPYSRPAAYIAAWKHARQVFQASGNMAPWIWSPNITSVNSPELTAFYPGDDQSEYVGLDGYSYPKAGSKPFAAIFDADLKALAGFSKRPRLICEAGVDKAVPNRASWITGMFAYLLDHPDIVGVTYWNRDQYAVDTDCALAFHLGVSALRATA
jgi:hypothetical protein